MISPKFSVIMPVFNRSHTVERAIFSIMKQTLKDFELIVVNDGSTDKTLSVLSGITDPRLKLIDQKNTRQTQARRVACMEANGTYIAFCDSDDIWSENYLEECLSVFEKYNSDIVFTNYQVQGELKPRIDLTVKKKREWLEKNSINIADSVYQFHDLYLSLLYYQPIFSSSMTVRRTHYFSIGGISSYINNKEFRTVITSEDSHLIRRCSITKSAFFINRNLVTLGRQGDNISHSYISNLKGGLFILEDIINNTNLSELQLTETRRSIRDHKKEIALQTYYHQPPSNYIKHYIKNYIQQLNFKSHIHFILAIKNYFKNLLTKTPNTRK